MIAYTFGSQLSGSMPDGAVLEYVFGAGGVYVRAMREGLEALVPVGRCEIRGLPEVAPFVRLGVPRVPAAALGAMLVRARQVCVPDPKEVLFHLLYEGGAWTLTEPLQEATANTVRPFQDGVGSSHHRALIEVHSHHAMPARFSTTDDSDEIGLRLYGVLGSIFTAPELSLRVGVHGYFWPVGIETVFEVPA